MILCVCSKRPRSTYCWMFASYRSRDVKDFPRPPWAAPLTKVGIAYRHEKQLGSPKTIRHRLREDGNYSRFFREFNRHLTEQWALLEDTSAEELTGNVALMCYEKDHKECHRHSVADALAELLGKTPIHLGVDDHAREASEAARSYPRQRVSRNLARSTKRPFAVPA